MNTSVGQTKCEARGSVQEYLEVAEGQKMGMASDITNLKARISRNMTSSIAVKLANAGVAFKEIAGNDSAILVTVLTDLAYDFQLVDCQVLFTQPITSKDDQKRIAFVTPVPKLGGVLKALSDHQITIEHVYDY